MSRARLLVALSLPSLIAGTIATGATMIIDLGSPGAPGTTSIATFVDGGSGDPATATNTVPHTLNSALATGGIGGAGGWGGPFANGGAGGGGTAQAVNHKDAAGGTSTTAGSTHTPLSPAFPAIAL